MDEKIKVGFCLTGSFCTFDRVLEQMQVLCAKQYDILPVMSYHASSLDTRFGTAHHFKETIKAITGKAVIDTIQGAEPIGPKKMTDVLLIAPCTGNTLGKLAHGIFDTPVLMAAKSHLRNARPLVLAVSTNDALGLSSKSIGMLMNMKHVYFVPMKQDDPVKKPRSVVADFTKIPQAIELALKGEQMQPIYQINA